MSAVRVTVTNTDPRQCVRVVTTDGRSPRGIVAAQDWRRLSPGASDSFTLYPRQHLRVEAIA